MWAGQYVPFRSGLHPTRGVVGRVGVDAYSVGRHALGWPGGYALCGYDTNVAQFESACGMCFGRIGEHRVSIAALPMIWNGWA